MVRLKEKKKQGLCDIVFIFQFLDGAIKRTVILQHTIRDIKISIP